MATQKVDQQSISQDHQQNAIKNNNRQELLRSMTSGMPEVDYNSLDNAMVKLSSVLDDLENKLPADARKSHMRFNGKLISKSSKTINKDILDTLNHVVKTLTQLNDPDDDVRNNADANRTNNKNLEIFLNTIASPLSDRIESQRQQKYIQAMHREALRREAITKMGGSVSQWIKCAGKTALKFTSTGIIFGSIKLILSGDHQLIGGVVTSVLGRNSGLTANTSMASIHQWLQNHDVIQQYIRNNTFNIAADVVNVSSIILNAPFTRSREPIKDLLKIGEKHVNLILIGTLIVPGTPLLAAIAMQASISIGVIGTRRTLEFIIDNTFIYEPTGKELEIMQMEQSMKKLLQREMFLQTAVKTLNTQALERQKMERSPRLTKLKKKFYEASATIKSYLPDSQVKKVMYGVVFGVAMTAIGEGMVNAADDMGSKTFMNAFLGSFSNDKIQTILRGGVDTLASQTVIPWAIQKIIDRMSIMMMKPWNNSKMSRSLQNMNDKLSVYLSEKIGHEIDINYISANVSTFMYSQLVGATVGQTSRHIKLPSLKTMEKIFEGKPLRHFINASSAVTRHVLKTGDVSKIEKLFDPSFMIPSVFVAADGMYPGDVIFVEEQPKYILTSEGMFESIKDNTKLSFLDVISELDDMHVDLALRGTVQVDEFVEDRRVFNIETGESYLTESETEAGYIVKDKNGVAQIYNKQALRYVNDDLNPFYESMKVPAVFMDKILEDVGVYDKDIIEILRKDFTLARSLQSVLIKQKEMEHQLIKDQHAIQRNKETIESNYESLQKTVDMLSLFSKQNINSNTQLAYLKIILQNSSVSYQQNTKLLFLASARAKGFGKEADSIEKLWKDDAKNIYHLIGKLEDSKTDRVGNTPQLKHDIFQMSEARHNLVERLDGLNMSIYNTDMKTHNDDVHELHILQQHTNNQIQEQREIMFKAIKSGNQQVYMNAIQETNNIVAKGRNASNTVANRSRQRTAQTVKQTQNRDQSRRLNERISKVRAQQRKAEKRAKQIEEWSMDLKQDSEFAMDLMQNYESIQAQALQQQQTSEFITLQEFAAGVDSAIMPSQSQIKKAQEAVNRIKMGNRSNILQQQNIKENHAQCQAIYSTARIDDAGHLVYEDSEGNTIQMDASMKKTCFNNVGLNIVMTAIFSGGPTVLAGALKAFSGIPLVGVVNGIISIGIPTFYTVVLGALTYGVNECNTDTSTMRKSSCHLARILITALCKVRGGIGITNPITKGMCSMGLQGDAFITGEEMMETLAGGVMDPEMLRLFDNAQKGKPMSGEDIGKMLQMMWNMMTGPGMDVIVTLMIGNKYSSLRKDWNNFIVDTQEEHTKQDPTSHLSEREAVLRGLLLFAEDFTPLLYSAIIEYGWSATKIITQSMTGTATTVMKSVMASTFGRFQTQNDI